MTLSELVPFLAFFTLLAVVALALIGKARIERRRKDKTAPVSTLAKDAPEGGAVERMD